MRIYGDGAANSVLETAIKIQSNSEIDDMTVSVPSSGTTAPEVVGSQVWAHNVDFTEANSTFDFNTLNLGTAGYVFISDCNFTGNEAWLGSATTTTSTVATSTRSSAWRRPSPRGAQLLGRFQLHGTGL